MTTTNYCLTSVYKKKKPFKERLSYHYQMVSIISYDDRNGF
jgi:hypothetical protein